MQIKDGFTDINEKPTLPFTTTMTLSLAARTFSLASFCLSRKLEFSSSIQPRNALENIFINNHNKIVKCLSTRIDNCRTRCIGPISVFVSYLVLRASSHIRFNSLSFSELFNLSYPPLPKSKQLEGSSFDMKWHFETDVPRA